MRLHGENLAETDAYTTADNFALAKAKLGSDAVVGRLQNLIRARVELLQSKIDVQHDYIQRIIGEDAAAVDELQSYTDSHKLLEGIAGSTDGL